MERSSLVFIYRLKSLIFTQRIRGNICYNELHFTRVKSSMSANLMLKSYVWYIISLFF